jgi:hypothetical protein
MSNYAPKFGTFNFDSTSRATIQDWNDRVLVSASFTPRQTNLGSTFNSQSVDGHEISIRGFVLGATADLAKGNLDAMVAALYNGEQDLSIFDDRVIPCYLAGPLSIRPQAGSAHCKFGFDAKLRTGEPFWKDVGIQNIDYLGLTGVGPFSNVAPVNNGTAPARLIADITLASASESGRTIVLTNETTGKELKIHGLSLNQNKKVVIDFDRRAIHDGNDNELFVGIVEGSWWDLPGGGTQSTIRLSHNFAAGISTDLDVSYSFTPSYLTI